MTQRGWYGGAEKADTFFFEHDWKAVPGHPEEVATCDVCGLNRWSDEHMTPDERAKHKARAKELRERLAAPLDAGTTARLEQAYGPQPVQPLSPRQAEDIKIAENKQLPAADAAHTFLLASFGDDQDRPRCLMCGESEDSAKHQNVPVPVAASQTLTPLLGYTLNPSTTGGTATTYFTSTNETTSPANMTINISGADSASVQRALTSVLSREAPGPAVVPPAAEENVKAFLTEVNGHTLLTGPASAFTVDSEKAATGNKHFLWMQGRFVGAEKANRNGAFWKTEDLELGELSVRNGPLNWLHEERHIIGTIANTQMVRGPETAGETLEQPYIQAASAIWRWIYQDEAWVIEQASDANALWYSMECISESVNCVGENGCGATAAYGDYVKGIAGCVHMVEHSATRHFANPTFLGGAVIVPPVRPGWAEANAEVMRQAASLAEKAFDAAGRPDMKATEWEQLMASVLRFAEVT